TRGQIPIVTLIPKCDDFKYFNTTGVFPYDPLAKMIAAEGIRYIDFGERIAKRIKDLHPESLYGSCSSHFNEAGYRQLAEIAFEYLMNDPETERRLLAGKLMRSLLNGSGNYVTFEHTVASPHAVTWLP